jgi:MOSC domain-containing protein YiiM
MTPVAHVRTVSVGLPKDREWAGIGRTSIDKRPVTGPVVVHPLGLEGDQVSDTRHHGGPHQAVYAYAREDLDFWEGELGVAIRDGQFAENLTTEGIDLNGLAVGTRLQVGAAGTGPLLEVAHVRTPCNDFKNWMGETGYDPKGWVKRFALAARPGPYFRVLEPGVVAAGDPIEVVHRPEHDVSVTTLFRALTTHRVLLPELAVVEHLPPEVQRLVDESLSR